MNNPFKNNSLASGLLGFILGAGTLAGGQVMMDTSNSGNNNNGYNQPSSLFQSFDENSHRSTMAFHGLEDNPDGDVVITKSGECYHSAYGCSSLSRSRNLRTVDRSDAEAVGISACSKCNP